MNETNIYKDFYEAQQQVNLLKNTIMSIAERLITATGIKPGEATMDSLLDAVDAKFGVCKEEEAKPE
ncbi:hypothetical protein [Escherichia phage pEC-M719-6WT.1]|uniref:Uncharacterized protein n=1 Tax=Escherichia phage pEC-M719-6WT.1 TaxID=3056220 RepID=A0AA51U6E2_9CAUD|nr:hypothetical protein [Escherichia phage pEC-M719-6WT.1]